jgi:predicted heme/steroid binding protein
MSARHSVSRAPEYTVHELKMADGSRVQQYVAGNGRVFAVRWNTLYKPDLSAMLGTSFPDYSSAAQLAARRGGIQRQFRHEGDDLVVQSSAHLHVFSGYAYRRAMLPRGVSPQSIGLG